MKKFYDAHKKCIYTTLVLAIVIISIIVYLYWKILIKLKIWDNFWSVIGSILGVGGAYGAAYYSTSQDRLSKSQLRIYENKLVNKIDNWMHNTEQTETEVNLAINHLNDLKERVLITDDVINQEMNLKSTKALKKQFLDVPRVPNSEEDFKKIVKEEIFKRNQFYINDLLQSNHIDHKKIITQETDKWPDKEINIEDFQNIALSIKNKEYTLKAINDELSENKTNVTALLDNIDSYFENLQNLVKEDKSLSETWENKIDRKISEIRTEYESIITTCNKETSYLINLNEKLNSTLES